MMKQVPYNTGKVLIGCRYEPVRHHTTTITEEFWQGILLGDNTNYKWGETMRNFRMVFAYFVAVMAMVLIGALLIVWVSPW